MRLLTSHHRPKVLRTFGARFRRRIRPGFPGPRGEFLEVALLPVVRQRTV